jgi:MFS family permease
LARNQLPDLYTDRDLARARRRGKYVGWLQGGVAVLAVGIGYTLIGWIPTLLVLGLVGFVIYKLVRRPKSEDV